TRSRQLIEVTYSSSEGPSSTQSSLVLLRFPRDSAPPGLSEWPRDVRAKTDRTSPGDIS
ncbi:hypothetical protein BaRGS_00010133, partial [Batillaria attramentaria]